MTQRVDDFIVEWWVTPFGYESTPDVYRLGGYSSTGQVVAAQVSLRGPDARVVLGSTSNIDDHNTPALWGKPGRRTIAIWTRHGMDPYLRMKVSEPTGTLSTLAGDTERLIDAPGGASYAQIHHIPHQSDADNDKFIVFTRIGLLTWRYFYLTINQTTGAHTVSAFHTLLTSAEQCYITTANAYDPSEHIIRFAWGYNPAAGRSAIRYVELNLTTGAITSPVDPNVAANLDGTDLPLVDENVGPLVPEPASTESRRLFYVRPGPMPPAVAYADWTRTSPDDATYQVMQRTAEGWAVSSYGTAGPRFGYTANANYLAGMNFPDPCTDDIVVVARQRPDGVSEVERYQTTEGVRTSRVVATDPANRLIRPFFAPGRDDRLFVCEVTYYGHYDTFYSTLRTVFGNEPVTRGKYRDGATIKDVHFVKG